MPATDLLERNAALANAIAQQDQAIVPRHRTIVLTCGDHRVDPAHVLGLALGDAVVLRNPGGRLTNDVLQSLLVLRTIGQVEGLQARLEFVIMHHTDCGLSRLAGPDHAPLMAGFVGVSVSEIPELHLDDPVRSVQYDVARFRSLGVLPADTPLLGVVLDLATGHVTQHAGPFVDSEGGSDA